MRQHKVKTRGGIQVLRELTVKKDCKDIKGWGIPRGTKLFITKEGPVHPTDKYKLLVVRVDNGTGMINLCPETCVRSNEVE